MNMRSEYITFFLIAALITALLFLINIFFVPTIGGDSEWYIAAAGGHWDKIIEPYSGRFLHPFLAGLFSRYSGLNIYQSFSILAIVSVFLFFILNIAISKNTVRSPLLLFPLFFLPYFLDTLREVFEPDPLYIFITALFFFFLLLRKEIMTLSMLFLLLLARESTILLGLIYAGMSWFWSKKFLTFAIVVIVVISFLTTGVIKNIGQPNVHNLSSPVYLVFKLSYNFLTNVAGVRPWINTSNACEPVLRFHLPPLKSLGAVQEIGFCGFDFSLPLKALITLLTVFGIAPLVLFYILAKKFRYVLKEFPFWILLALAYGLAHYVIGIFAGTGIQRIMGYSWPAFLVAVPVFILTFFETDKTFIIKISLIQLFTAWLPFVVYRLNGNTTSSSVFIILVVSVVYFYVFRFLKGQKMKDAAVPSLLLS